MHNPGNALLNIYKLRLENSLRKAGKIVRDREVWEHMKG